MSPEVEAYAVAWYEWSQEPEFPFSADHCINGSRIAVLTLKRLGVAAKPVSVEFVLFNRMAWMLYLQERPVDEWPPEAWSLGVGEGQAKGVPNKWDGHLAVEGNGWMLDVSAGQFARPGRLRIDGPRLIASTLPANGDWMFVEDSYGQVLMIRRWPANNVWRESPGWRRLHEEEVAEMVRRTKDRLMKGAG